MSSLIQKLSFGLEPVLLVASRNSSVSLEDCVGEVGDFVVGWSLIRGC